jgi:hypothetical protein
MEDSLVHTLAKFTAVGAPSVPSLDVPVFNPAPAIVPIPAALLSILPLLVAPLPLEVHLLCLVSQVRSNRTRVDVIFLSELLCCLGTTRTVVSWIFNDLNKGSCAPPRLGQFRARALCASNEQCAVSDRRDTADTREPHRAGHR